jgi:hypothetical protein
VEEYEKAVSGPVDMPKANPPQKVDKIHPGAKYGDKPPEKRIPVDQYVKPLGSFKGGTDYVPKTGHYKLHEGEAVTPKEDNPMADVMAMVPGRTAKKPKKVIDHIRVYPHKDGSHTVQHHHTHPEHHDVETHGLSNMDGLHAHMEDHIGQPNSGEAEADAGTPEAYTGGAPAAAPAGASGAAPAAPAA